MPCQTPLAATAPHRARDAGGNRLLAGKEVEAESTSVPVHAASPCPVGLLRPPGTAGPPAAPTHLAPGRGAARPSWRDTEAPGAGWPLGPDSPDSVSRDGVVAGFNCGRVGLGEDGAPERIPCWDSGQGHSAAPQTPEFGSMEPTRVQDPAARAPGQGGSSAAPTHRGPRRRQELHEVVGEEPSLVPALPVPPALNLCPLRARAGVSSGDQPRGCPRPRAPLTLLRTWTTSPRRSGSSSGSSGV